MDGVFIVSSGDLVFPSRTPSDSLNRRLLSSSRRHVPISVNMEGGRRRGSRNRVFVSAFGIGGGRTGESSELRRNAEKLVRDDFARISGSSQTTQTSSVGTPPSLVSPAPSSVGSPLFWIGVGIGFSALYSLVVNYLKKNAMQQAFKAMNPMMGSVPHQSGPFNNPAMFPGSTFPIPPVPPPITRTPTPQISSEPVVTVDAPASEAEPATSSEDSNITEEPRKFAFIDVSPENSSQTGSAEGFRYPDEVASLNGNASKQDKSDTNKQSESQNPSLLSVDALEKLMEDPTMQKMVYPYLPEEMRNPSTFKWMLQNPVYREQLQEMLNKMGGSGELDNQMMNSLKNFDLSNPEVKQQFDQIGLTPEDVISKIMSNPDVAVSFQNPKVQAAIIDCSQDPMNISKYQDDKEVMDVFNKISELFPGVSGY